MLSNLEKLFTCLKYEYYLIDFESYKRDHYN